MFFHTITLASLVVFVLSSPVSLDKRVPLKVVLTNDDGWAEANIRAVFTSLLGAGYEVLLSGSAENGSGTGSSTKTPTTLTEPCEFNSCPTGNPAIGHNSSDTRLNWVNAFPVDAARIGIQQLAPSVLGGAPDFVVSGFNVGQNLGSTVQISGTVGAASEAAILGIPSVAFSGDGSSQVSYTTLDTDSAGTEQTNVYASLTTIFTNAMLVSPSRPILPANISVNVNFASSSSSTCSSPSDFKFALTRILSGSGGTDFDPCSSTGQGNLPTESSVVAMSGCWVSVSVFNATTKADVAAATQEAVYNRISSIMSCPT